MPKGHASHPALRGGNTIALADKLDPSPVLARINAKATAHDDGRVSYTGWDFQENVALLHGMLATAPSVSRTTLREAVNRAVSQCVREQKLTGERFIGAVRQHYERGVGKNEGEFVLLTEFSVRGEPLWGKYQVGDARVRLIKGAFARKYASRGDTASVYQTRGFPSYPNDYQKVCVEMQAKSDSLAAQLALDAADSLRGLFNMYANFAMEIQLGNEQWKPINRITLGGLHTVHSPDGTQTSDRFWYEPLARFQKTHVMRPEKSQRVVKRVRKVLGYLNRSRDRSFADRLLRSLNQYTRAYDEPDPSNCLMKGWAVLEQLAGDDAIGDSERVVRRVSFLYTSHTDQRLSLEVIRRARNDLAHRGQGADHLRTYCYQLQRYFIDVFEFYLSNLRASRSRDESNQLLDLSPRIEDMHQKRSELRAAMGIVRRGIRFRVPRDVD